MSALTLDRTPPVTTISVLHTRDCRAKDDIATERKAETVLNNHAHFRGRRQQVRCRCLNRSLRLVGTVESYYLKQLAQEALRGLDGVDRIENRLMVMPQSTVNVGEHLYGVGGSG